MDENERKFPRDLFSGIVWYFACPNMVSCKYHYLCVEERENYFISLYK